MIIYLDSSALVKRYLSETGSEETVELVDSAESITTAEISRVEVSAALARSVRVGALSLGEAQECVERFRRDWRSIQSVRITETVMAQADQLVWQYDLRAYDSIQLAAAQLWQTWMGTPLTFATYDERLWKVARQNFDGVFPAQL